jgi:SPOR domain
MASDEIDLRQEDRLPWLETVEPDEPERAGVARVIVAVLIGLALVAAAAWAFTRLRPSASPEGTGALIAAQEGDYKIRPDDPGGLKVKGEGDTAIATSAGAAGQGAIDLKAVPEAPITGRHAQAPAQRKAGETRTAAEVPASGGRLAARPPMQAPRAPVPGAASGGSLVQLGAFPSEGAANAAWSAIAKRFGYVATLGKDVQPAEVNGRKVFRLRVNAGSAGAAADICGRLKVAGESCFVTS